MSVRGLKEIKANLGLAQKLLGIGVRKGMNDAANFVKARSLDEVPIVTGKLRDSAYVRIEGIGPSTHALVGYSAPYAIFVHEDMKAKHPQGRAKFLERAVRRNRKLILELIARTARLP